LAAILLSALFMTWVLIQTNECWKDIEEYEKEMEKYDEKIRLAQRLIVPATDISAKDWEKLLEHR